MDKKYEQLKEWIDESKYIVFFGGAGVSTESGIPDFRSENGIFQAINEYGVRPEVILSIFQVLQKNTALSGREAERLPQGAGKAGARWQAESCCHTEY